MFARARQSLPKSKPCEPKVLQLLHQRARPGESFGSKDERGLRVSVIF